MLQYSLTTSRDGKTIIKIHHDFGDFNFYLMPSQSNNRFGWASDPILPDEKLGRSIALEAAKSIAQFAKRNFETITFEDMASALKNAQRVS